MEGLIQQTSLVAVVVGGPGRGSLRYLWRFGTKEGHEPLVDLIIHQFKKARRCNVWNIHHLSLKRVKKCKCAQHQKNTPNYEMMPKPDWNERRWILGHLLSNKTCSVDLLFATDSSSSSSSWCIWWVCLRADYSGFNAAYWRSLPWHHGDGAELEYVSNMLWILSKSWLR